MNLITTASIIIARWESYSPHNLHVAYKVGKINQRVRALEKMVDSKFKRDMAYNVWSDMYDLILEEIVPMELVDEWIEWAKKNYNGRIGIGMMENARYNKEYLEKKKKKNA